MVQRGLVFESEFQLLENSLRQSAHMRPSGVWIHYMDNKNLWSSDQLYEGYLKTVLQTRLPSSSVAHDRNLLWFWEEFCWSAISSPWILPYRSHGHAAGLRQSSCFQSSQILTSQETLVWWASHVWHYRSRDLEGMADTMSMISFKPLEQCLPQLELPFPRTLPDTQSTCAVKMSFCPGDSCINFRGAV